MGQYIRAIPLGASAAVLFSLLVALTITPYFGYRLLKVKQSESDEKEEQQSHKERGEDSPFVVRYRCLLAPFVRSAILRWFFYLGLVILLLLSLALVATRSVQIGLTPLLDRNLFAVKVELPATATLTESLGVASDLNRQLRQLPEVRAVTLYAGLTPPMIYPPETLTAPTDKAPRDLTLHVSLVPDSSVTARATRSAGRWLNSLAAGWRLTRPLAI
ncbi:efflux RND transporter permease subunit [Halomonas sp. TBZ9]|uniref:Efflux RND transporter permease subunit n=1 Tax=Vreelandella azerica TaxID=2732867 RepID=A0A7Y3TYP7_9GAMM|nr:efflux RND transporter permease subunit [Halomonas azerica]